MSGNIEKQGETLADSLVELSVESAEQLTDVKEELETALEERREAIEALSTAHDEVDCAVDRAINYHEATISEIVWKATQAGKKVDPIGDPVIVKLREQLKRLKRLKDDWIDKAEMPSADWMPTELDDHVLDEEV